MEEKNQTDNHSSLIRYRKSSMVLFSIERSIVNYLAKQDLSGPECVKILTALSTRLNNRNDGPTLEASEILQNCYLEDTLQLLSAAARGTGSESSVSRLMELVRVLQIYLIRNACAHPTKDFPSVYWYSVATLASDPLFAKLGINEPIEALASAESNSIFDPPIEWLEALEWELPNNLPEQLDFLDTGLIGRKDLKQSLRGLLTSDRTNSIALVAKGGVGKTALACEVLLEICHDLNSSSIIDCVIYSSFKAETLDTDGIRKIAVNISLDDIKLSILESISDIYGESYASISEFTSKNEDQRAILCIDNAETLLANDPSVFHELYDWVPREWRLLITSRVAVDGARTVPVGDLSNSDALALIHKYSRIKGIALDTKAAKKIAENHFGNPLALKLTIDYIGLGHSFHEASGTAASQIAEFSFNKLIDALSDGAITVLEIVFVMNGCSRADVISLAQIDADSIAASISELVKTSLIIRSIGDHEETFTLNDSVRNFARTNPRNMGIRPSIESIILKARNGANSASSTQAQRGIELDSIYYVPKDAPSQLQRIAFDTNSLVKKKNRGHVQNIASLISRYRDLESAYEKTELFWRFYGRAMWTVDRAAAIDIMRKAVSLAPEKPQSKAILAWYYLFNSELDDAIGEFEKLEKDGWASADKSGASLYSYIRNGLLRSFLYANKYDEILIRTSEWNRSETRVEDGIFRLGALRQLPVSQAQRGANLCECFTIGNRLIEVHGHTKDISAALLKLCKDAFYALNNDFFEDPVQACIDLKFHVDGLVRAGHSPELTWFLTEFPQNSVKFPSEVAVHLDEMALMIRGLDAAEEQRLLDEGYVPLFVSSPPLFRGGTMGKFFFAKDRLGTAYFVSIDALINCNWTRWQSISTETRLVAKIEKSLDPGKSPFAVEAILV